MRFTDEIPSLALSYALICDIRSSGYARVWTTPLQPGSSLTSSSSDDMITYCFPSWLTLDADLVPLVF